MTRKTQQFIAAFAVAVIFIGALCGFVLVDLSTDRYLPAQFGALFQIGSISDAGVRFTAMGTEYSIAAEQFDTARRQIWEYRGLLPGNINLTACLTAQAYSAAQDYLEAQREPEEPW